MLLFFKLIHMKTDRGDNTNMSVSLFHIKARCVVFNPIDMKTHQP